MSHPSPGLALSLVFFFGAASSSAQLERVAEDVEVPSVTVAELTRALDEGSVDTVVDVRLKEDYAADPVLIPNATWKDPHEILAWAEELESHQRVVVYCVKGRWVSQSVTKKLLDMGIDVAQLDGGIEAWKDSNQPTSPGPRR